MDPKKKPILEVLRGAESPGEVELPDEAQAANQIRFAPGALDGIATHHMRLPTPEEAAAGVDELLAVLELAATDDSALEDLNGVVARDGFSVVRLADALAMRVTSQSRLAPEDALRIGRRLVETACNREALKLGILLVGLCGGEEDLPNLRLLGRHDEFTLFCAVAIGNMVEDPAEVWWQMAAAVDGWGKIHLVERLAAVAGDRPYLQHWLVRHGCANSVLPDYLAFTCASAGNLAEALAVVEPDDALLDGACLIITSLLGDGPTGTIDSYEDGAAAVERLLQHLAVRCDTLPRLYSVATINDWLVQDGEAPWDTRESLGWTPSLRSSCTAICEAILAAPEWPEKIHASYVVGTPYEQGLAWALAERVGADLWNEGYHRLEAAPLEARRYFELLSTKDLVRIARVLDFAEAHLPLRDIASGPGQLLGLGPGFEAHACLDACLQAMASKATYRDVLVAAALRSPVVRNRNLAIAVLESQPPAVWGEATRAALLAADSYHDESLQRMRAQIFPPA